jgi:hypothetical protein
MGNKSKGLNTAKALKMRRHHSRMLQKKFIRRLFDLRKNQARLRLQPGKRHSNERNNLYPAYWNPAIGKELLLVYELS